MAKMDNERPGQGHEQEMALFTSAGFREESASQPLVYGYVRLQQQPDQLVVCRRALERYCQRERLRLCTVFADHGVGDDVVIRPGLTGLCDVLRLPDSFAAVLVSITHLSRDSCLAEQMVGRVRDTGARLLFVRHTTSNPADPTSSRCTRTPEWWQ